MITIPLLDYTLRTQAGQVWDGIRKAWVALSPEEHVRQLLIQHLTTTMHYPAALMAVEKSVGVGNGLQQRFDLVVYDRHHHKPWLIAECKAPDVPITDATLHQLLRYHAALQCRYWLLSNGHQHFCADAGNPEKIEWLTALPAYEP